MELIEDEWPNRPDRRTFLGLLVSATAAPAALFAASVRETPAREGAVSLAGDWRFALDEADIGAADNWFGKTLPSDHAIRLPGILQTQGYGEEITAQTQFVAALPRDMRWYMVPQYKAYTRLGNVKVPYLSQPVRHFLGVAWYQRDIDVPAAWAGKRIALQLERTRWRTDVYVDDRLAGSNRSLVAPHDVELGILPPGPHRLTLRIDNRMQEPAYRPDGHSVSDGEGATWNGVVGRIELSATSPVWIDDVQVFPDLARRAAQVRVKIGNLTGQSGSGTLRAGAFASPVTWTESGGEGVIEVALPGAKPWTEFTPHLESLTVTLGGGGGADDQRLLSFGMREITADGRRLRINGELLDLRMTHDGGGFPLTGYPATDIETWSRIITICKRWGLNGMRFHSWCPPEAAFAAADRLGFYLQPECGMWNRFDPERRMLAVLHDETERMIRAYGNHPSFVMLAASNEPAGEYARQLPEWDIAWRKADPRRLYTDGTGRVAPPPGGPGTPFAADYLVIGSPARGPRGWFGEDYDAQVREATHGVDIPVIGHEIGQYCAYPDFSVIAKFAGKGPYAAYPQGIGWGDRPYMIPGNYEIMRDSAAGNNLLARNRDIAHASGRFQLACYKEEVEANFRTASHAGLQLLDLHDYLGQGGALIGLLDAFWEEKGYVRPDEFRAFCGPTVPLVRLKERVFTSERTLTLAAELYHHGPAALPMVRPVWRIVDRAGKTMLSGTLPERPAPRGRGLPLGTIEAELATLPAPAAYTLILELAGTPFRNQWSFWVYPAARSAPAPAGVTITASWDAARTALAGGGRVLFLSGTPATPNPDLAMTSVPVFWNRLMNANRAWMLGMLCDHDHGGIAAFPGEAHCDWQWIDLVSKTSAMNVGMLPAALRPIVQPIDDWNRNLRLAVLFEATVGPGRLMVSAIDLSETGADRHAGGPTLRAAVLGYMASSAFRPAIALAPEALAAWAVQRHVAPARAVIPAATQDIVDPGQIRRS